MNAVALVESEDHVCVRYRLAAFRDALRNAGHGLELRPLAKTVFGRLRQYQSVRTQDAVILQRTLLPAFELGVLRRNARRLIFDFDDAIWQRDSYSPRGPHSAKRSRRFAKTVRLADHCIAGNAFLASKVKPHAVTLIPSCVKPMHSSPSLARPDDGLTLVWIGSSSTLRSLEAIRPILIAIGCAFPDVRLKLICDRFASFAPLPVDCVPWSAATEACELATSNVGIAVMPDDDWSRGKCGVKVLQYLAAGLPVIANPVGVHTELVRPGETGYLATSTDEWLAAIRKLHDAGVRANLGFNGRRLVDADYSIAVGAAAWCGLFKRLSLRQAC